jgi:hypothetical protein
MRKSASDRKVKIRKVGSILSLVSLLSAMLLPWLSSTFLVRSHQGYFVSRMFWSVQAVTSSYGQTSSYSTFSQFWFNPQLGQEVGIYYGWIPVFVFQVLSAVFVGASALKTEIMRRKWHTDLAAAFLLLTLLGFGYQFYVQQNIESAHILRGFQIGISSGFLLAAISALLFLGAYLNESRKRLTHGIMAVGKNWKIAVPVAVWLCVLLPIGLELLQARTDVVKKLCVGKNVPTNQFPIDPALWTDDFSRISSTARLFQAKIEGNFPNYAHCHVSCPVISSEILKLAYERMGYKVEQIFYLYID